MTTQKTHQGILSLNTKGTGFVRVEGEEEAIEIQPEALGLALHKDTVLIHIHPGKNRYGKKTGEVIKVIKAHKRAFTGVVQSRNNVWYVIPDDTKMPFDILLPPQNDATIAVGDKVYVRIQEWPHRQAPIIGSIEEVLGRHGTHESEMRAIALDQGFQSGFPKAVQDAADALKANGIAPEEYTKRRDMRDATTFTIDPADAKDFDDALSVRQIDETTYEIGVHIADVSHYVREGDVIDTEAYQRATSVYLVDRTIPMLPNVLSDDLCSLNQGEDKLTYGAVFTIKTDSTIIDTWIGRTVIHSNKRFTYEEAQAIIDAREGLYAQELLVLNTISKALIEARKKRYALSLEQDEVRFILNEEKEPIAVYTKPRLDTNQLVEEFMLLANVAVATYLAHDPTTHEERLGLYRVHASPSADRIQELVEYVALFGYDLKTNENGSVSAKTLFEFMESIPEGPERVMLSTHVVRSMQKAIYTTKNIGHFGLAYDFYTHFTSPIRRYPDIIVHRLATTYIQGKTIPRELWSTFEEAALHTSEQEKMAQTAERGSIKYKQVEYMAKRVGQIFTGRVTGITKWGVYIEEDETKCEGMASLRKGEQELFTFDPDTFTITSTTNGSKIRLGDSVRMKVQKTNLDRKQIDYDLVL